MRAWIDLGLHVDRILCMFVYVQINLSTHIGMFAIFKHSSMFVVVVLLYNAVTSIHHLDTVISTDTHMYYRSI